MAASQYTEPILDAAPRLHHTPKKCTLNIHDEGFSKHEVLLSGSLIGNWNVKPGTPLRLSASTTHVRRGSTHSLSSRNYRRSSTKSSDVTLIFTYHELSQELHGKYPNLGVSVSQNIAASLGLSNRSDVFISEIDEEEAKASHVEIVFRDAYLTRADMWQLVCSELAGKAIYKGQKLTFLGSIKASIKSIYKQGEKLTSGFFAPSTKPIFRSESARYVIFLQMSKEMWDFEPEGSGEIMFSKVIDGFLPELFRRWHENNARHLISIVLFTRMEYRSPDKSGDVQTRDNEDIRIPWRDFYRVLTLNMESGHHEAVLLQLKKDFKTFLRDISVRPSTDADAASLFQDGSFSNGKVPVDTIQGHPSPATRGNILEAINTASSQFSEDYIDRDLLRTGLAVVIVTPGTGVFEVDPGLLNLTTDFLIENGVGIDLVCLARMPLHSVPLFKYRKEVQKSAAFSAIVSDTIQRRGSVMPDQIHMSSLSGTDPSEPANSGITDQTDSWNYAIPHWLDISFWTPRASGLVHKSPNIRNFSSSKVKPFLARVKMYEIQMMGIMENDTNIIALPYLEPYQKSLPGKDSQLGAESLKNYSSNGNLRKSLSRSETYGSRESDPVSTSYSPRSPNHINSAKSLSGLIHWMEDYDANTFKIPKPLQVAMEIPRPMPLRSQTTHDTSIFGLQTLAEGSEHKTDSPTPKKPPMLGSIPSKSSAAVMTRKTSNTSLFGSSGGNSKGSIKGNKQTGTGFKGFGFLTAKATASVQLSSETAQKESLLSHAVRSFPNPARSVAADSASATTSEGKLTPRSSTDEERSASIPISPQSKPISIRNTGREGEHPAEMNSLISTIDGSLTPRKTGQMSIPDEVNLMEAPGGRVTLQRALAPWFTILNPSNPNLMAADPSSRLGRWHHVFPRPLSASTIKWKSLCAPASIPLTTEGFPSAEQLASEYDSTSWTVTASPLADEDTDSSPRLMRELICARLSNGYQVVIGSHIAEIIGDSRLKNLNFFDEEQVLQKYSEIYMSRGVQIHRLIMQKSNVVEVKQYIRIRGHGIGDDLGKRRNLVYTPEVKTSLSQGYQRRKITISTTREAYDWKRLDVYIAGNEQEQDLDIPEELRYWRARYVLIPMQPSSNLKKLAPNSSEDNDEEIRLEGIYKLTQLWQKNRYAPVKEPHQRVVARTAADSNPLDIIFRTKPPSAVVASELHDSLLERGPSEGHPRNLLPDSELLNRTAVDLKALAQLLQSEKGVKMQDRRWHFRTHSNCFIGLEFVTWLVDNFKDIDSREDAVEFGEQLMREGLFVHVERRHNFRDGNFFYQIGRDYGPPRSEKAQGWFRNFASVPSTPISENRSSPRALRPQSSDEEESSDRGSKTPTEKSPLTQVTLSKKLIYDVDRRKRSYRREIINLHYDRVSSADDCYHIRINWLNVTPKLVEDAVSSWASAIERYGLRLVEIPISEASRVNELHTFRSPYIIKLAKQPPELPPRIAQDTSSLGVPISTIRFPYQKALLKKFNFVLDLEAANDFPASVDVSYSWGKPDYQSPQFLSRDGVLLAQITDDGNFLLLANRLSNNRRGTQGSMASRPYSVGLLDGKLSKPNTPSASAAPANAATTRPPSLQPTSPRGSPYASPMIRATPDVLSGMSHRTDIITPVSLKDPLEVFCKNAKLLEKFYEEVTLDRGGMTAPATPDVGPIMDGRISLPPVPPFRDLAFGSIKEGKR